jgi:hypothetical protein
MKSFWVSVAWVADYVLKVCWPLEQEPSMWDLEAKAQEDEIISNWEPEPSLDDQLAYMGCLLEDIRNILLSSFAPVEQPGVADERPAPDSAIPPAPGAGHPTLTRDELSALSYAAYQIAISQTTEISKQRWIDLSDKADPYK